MADEHVSHAERLQGMDGVCIALRAQDGGVNIRVCVCVCVCVCGWV
jgi:hypothetical protein